MTERLYLADDTVTTFEATVERVLSGPDRLVLDQTHFYPTGGGQPHDTGTIRVDDGDGTARWRVVDVKMADTVYHEVEPIGGGEADSDDGSDAASALPEPGTEVACEVDADRRAAHSRYHTAQHLLSALLLDEFDARTTGNQLYHDRARLDAEYDRFSDDDLDRIESRLNALVVDGRPVSSYAMDRETAEATLDTDRTRIDLLPDSIEELRIVEIAGADAEDEPYDRTACAGTHVATTADVGDVVVTGRETKGPEEERVRFALADHVDAD
ncbi:MAG: alanyl-tRNA editing protein [Methanobacteriota archaeon]